MAAYLLQIVTCMLYLSAVVECTVYSIDDSNGFGPKFDGIGGLSGGGATSRLLPSYSDNYKSQILDLLFKPNFAASLQILKVEIGGDGQSTDGTESSHMHSEDDENYQRGYEWWLMTEAKKRNPSIKLYGLPWAFPGWVGNDTNSPYTYPELTAGYIVKWIQGAKSTYNLDINYVGIWNERKFDVTYIKTLRKSLDEVGLNNVEIVAADGSFSDIADAILKDKELADAVSILGAHYPGTVSSDNAKQTNKILWSSEDYSTYNDDTGAGCWARILNQNYVNGGMTSTISWNLIASYYNGLPYYRDGLMTATEPWSGHFDINGPVYITAHTTQFTTPGDLYLKIGSGAGHFQNGGSYVSFHDPSTNDLTIVIETMTHDHSKCIRPPLPSYDVIEQSVTFILKGSFSDIKELYRWDSQLFNTSGPQYFIKNGTVEVEDDTFQIYLPVDHVMTLSTKTGQVKGEYTSPDSKPFPLPYQDNFDSYPLYSEANYFADQFGVYEIRQSSVVTNKSGHVMTQVVPQHVISWCGDADQTITIFGQSSWQSFIVTVEVMLPNITSTAAAAFLAGRIDRGGCGIPNGIFFWISTANKWTLTSDLAGKKILTSKDVDIKPNTFIKLTVNLHGSTASLLIDGATVADNVEVGTGSGFIGLGTSGYFPVEFDNFAIVT